MMAKSNLTLHSLILQERHNRQWLNPDLTLSNLTIYSNNSRTDYAMAGHLLNITITANEALKTANVTVFGITSMMIVNGTTASANVTVDENSAEGVVSFNITAFDLAGNSLTVNQQLNSSNLTIDADQRELHLLTPHLRLLPLR